MFWRKKHDIMYSDAATNDLLDNGVYSIHRPAAPKERGPFGGREHKGHNMLSGLWYVFILSCLLWWLPLFGQMIAGYIGGRKAGSPIRGVLVTVIPALIILLLIIGMDVGLFPFLGVIAGIPTMVMGGIHSLSPNAGHFLSGIYESLRPVVGLEGSGFLIIVCFGLIGGMMADMNKKEISHAAGGAHFYDAFFGRLSGASLSKFADMVAERVIWTLGTIDQGSRNLIGRIHHEPNQIGFEELRGLPSASVSSSPYDYSNEGPSYQPENAFGYDPLPPQDEGLVPVNDVFVDDQPPAYPERRFEEPEEGEWGVTHRGPSEDSMIRQWKEHKRNIGSGKRGRKHKRGARRRSERFPDDKPPSNFGEEEKRDAVIYDSSGKLMNFDEHGKKAKKSSPKKKQPSLVTRALAADKEIKEKPNKEVVQGDISEGQKEEKKIRRVKPEQSFDRL